MIFVGIDVAKDTHYAAVRTIPEAAPGKAVCVSEQFRGLPSAESL